MRFKYILFIMQFLTSICIVSVGFSSWVIVSNGELTAQGTIYAEDIHTNENYIKVNSYTCFDYFDTGFVTTTFDSEGKISNQTISNSGTLSYNFLIDLSNCKAALKDGNTFKIVIKLTHETVLNSSGVSYELIKNYLSSFSVSESINVLSNNFDDNLNNLVLTIDVSQNVKSYTFDANNPSNRYLPLSINYIFTHPSTSPEDFKNDIYPCLVDEKFEFIQTIDIVIE